MAISRRTLLAAGGATTLGFGAAGAFALRSNGGESPSTPGATGTSTAVATPSPSPTSTAIPTPTAIPRGGTVRRTSPYPFSFDTFDALRTGEVSTLELLARTHSRLISWSEFPSASGSGAIGGDLAARWEQPDPSRIVLHLDPNASWATSGTFPARAVTAEDVIIHLRRAMALAREPAAPAVQRAWDYPPFATVTAPDSATVAIELSRPDPFVLETLASRFALVQRPEVVAQFEATWHELAVESVSGSGPWLLESRDGGRMVFRANRSGHRSPYLDSLEVHAPVRRVKPDDLASRDEWLIRDRRDTPGVVGVGTSAWNQSTILADSPVISTFEVAAAPWNDPRMIRALDYALGRDFLADALFAGRATAASIIPPQFGVDPDSQAAGLGPSESDAKEARLLWEAASGNSAGPVLLDLPTIFDPAYSAGATIAARLRQVLGVEVRLGGESYTAIARKSADHYYGNGRAALWFGWGPPVAEPSLARWFAETFASTSATAKTHGFASPAVDSAIAALQREPEAAKRVEMARTLAETLAVDRSGGVITWLSQRFETMRDARVPWPAATPFATQHLDAGLYRA